MRQNRRKWFIFWPIKIGAAAVLLASPGMARELDLSDLAGVSADIVIIGEIHDNPRHHQNQASVVKQLRPEALVFEMLSATQAKAAQDTDHSDMLALEADLAWADSGWPDFSMYFPIFEAAPTATLFGTKIHRDQLKQAIRMGAAQVFGENAAAFGLSSPMNPQQLDARLSLQDEAHCGALPSEMLPGMIEAQRLRDAHFARVALEALESTGGPVVVITGNGHARTDWGMPAALRQAAPDVSVLSIGQISSMAGSTLFDAWVLSPELVRDSDPCDAFKSN